MTALHVGPAEVAILKGYADTGVERVVLPLDTEDPQLMATLDHLALLTAGLSSV